MSANHLELHSIIMSKSELSIIYDMKLLPGFHYMQLILKYAWSFMQGVDSTGNSGIMHIAVARQR
ncbi:hypothetical protein GCM10011533_26820 [Streptosporangium jomthongense]|nr:hypothetical protein GCM10011533_26820 [Streptosporangium jomthongense]